MTVKAYAGRQFGPYVRAAVNQFSPKRSSLTQRLFEKLQFIRSGRGERAAGDPPGRENDSLKGDRDPE